MSAESKSEQRPIRLSTTLLKKAEKRAQELGVKFPEYVRQLITADTKDIKLD